MVLQEIIFEVGVARNESMRNIMWHTWCRRVSYCHTVGLHFVVTIPMKYADTDFDIARCSNAENVQHLYESENF